MDNPPRFDTVDWVALARSCGIYLRPTGQPMVLQLVSNTERTALAHHYIQETRNDPKLPKCYVRDSLDDMVIEGKITSLDKAIIMHRYRRLLTE